MAMHALSREPERSSDSSATDLLLVVEELCCHIDAGGDRIVPVDSVSFAVGRGRALGIVGESGSGKTMLMRAVIGLTPSTATVSGRVKLAGVDLRSLPRREQQRRRGVGIGMVFQNPMTSLNPVVPIGRQVTEGMRFRLKLNRGDARDRAAALLTRVGISDVRRRMRQYPHELSGGQRQRVAIAAALGCEPDLLIADEATTALDSTVQKQILELLKELQQERNMALILVSHDLGVVSGYTDEIAVMYAGRIVEMGPTRDLFAAPRHRYTAALLAAAPSLEHEPHTRLSAIAGAPPRLTEHLEGCRFAPRCVAATAECVASEPAPRADSSGRHWHKCLWPVDGDDGAAAPNAAAASK
jgi:peptide/nickel transport system ATP-binding protein